MKAGNTRDIGERIKKNQMEEFFSGDIITPYLVT